MRSGFKFLSAIGLWLVGASLARATSTLWDPTDPQACMLPGGPAYMSDDVRATYVSQGQQALRQYVRQLVLTRFLRSPGNGRDEAALEMALASPNPGMPLDTRIHLSAAEEGSRYLQRTSGLPLNLEVRSIYLLNPCWQVVAQVDAPLDETLGLRLASEYQWNPNLSTELRYQHGQAFERDEGMLLGLDFTLASWKLLIHSLWTPSATQRYRVTLDQSF